MSKQQFKVGDRVRILSNFLALPTKGATGTIIPDKPNTICAASGRYIKLDNPAAGTSVVWVRLYDLELIEPNKPPVIVITSDGKTTTATLRKGKKVIKTATATCSEKDTFDFSEGARVAFERLHGRDPFPREKKPEYYNGKIVCISSVPPRLFTVGRVYKVVDGRFRADNGDYSRKYSSVGEINQKFGSQFAELVED